MIGVGIIGYGVMGRTHAAAYRRAARSVACEIRGVYGGSATAADTHANLRELAEGDILPPGARVHDSLDALLADERITVVSVCTPTDTHVALAEQALAAGKHVLVEKPVALSAVAVEGLADAAAQAQRLCMPAMCMRFWPGWPWLREHVRLGTFGAVQSARFERLGEPPAWAPEFYRDEARSGGPLFDLHVHDVDFALWCFGPPQAVHATGTRGHFVAQWEYEGEPPLVNLEGGWITVPGFGFRMRYRVVFEDSVAEFRYEERQPLRVTAGGGTRLVPLARESAYDAEVRHFLRAVSAGTELRATLADAARATRIIEQQREQLTD